MGIIANPASGKDIRRLVAHAATIDNRGKVSIIRCALVGLGSVGVAHVLIMPDTDHLGERAMEGLRHVDGPLPQTDLLEMPTLGRAEDSAQAARLLREAGAGAIIVLGGDGTVRMVSKEAQEAPLLPISTGTNNVLPSFVEGTVAGMAAGLVALGPVPLEQVALRHKWIEVSVNGVPQDRALVDVAVLESRFVGSRAVWQAENVIQVVATRADASSIGISSIAGRLGYVSPASPQGIAVLLSPSAARREKAILGPGLIAEVGIESVQMLTVGDYVQVPSQRPLILALDGEREIPLYEPNHVSLQLRGDGPWIIDARRAMARTVRA